MHSSTKDTDMRDLNSLYTEYLIANINRERQEQRRIAEAAAGQPTPWQRLLRAVGAIRPARVEPTCEPTPLVPAKHVTTS